MPDSIYFSVSDLPKFSFVTESFAYEYDKAGKVVCTNRDQMSRQTREYQDTFSEQHPEIAAQNFRHLLDLCVNIVDYINAHNTTIRRTERIQADLEKINRKREKKGKKLLEPLKPYHWIDIVQHTLYDGKREKTESRMDYKEWVIGHFEKYHTKKGMIKHWIGSYVRGPDDAPWKENRYKVLDDMLKKGPK